jgi:hypothetical protein
MVAQLQGDRGPPDQGFLGTVVAEVPHPPAPGPGSVVQHRPGVETVVTVRAPPGQHQVQGIAPFQVVGAVQSAQT